MTLLLATLALALGCTSPEPAREDNSAAPETATATLPAAPAAAPAFTGPANAAAAPGGPGAGSAPAAAVAGTEAAPTASATASPLQTDSAGQILARAAAKYAEVRSLQANFSMSFENPLLRSKSTGTGVLYQKRPDRLLLRFSEPAGDVIMSDGRYFWIYYPSTDPNQVLRSPASAGGASGVDLQAQFLGDPTRRFRYELTGEQTVAGRRAWELRLTPLEPMGYRQLRVWIDQRDYLARRFEITEDNGSVRRFDLSGLRVNAALADDLFEFAVPAGARVITR